MNEIPDGPPVDMSKISLGPRYGSEDMYRDYPDLRLGDKLTFERDGVIYTDQIQSITYSSPEPGYWRPLTRWQQLKRRFTPCRWRKPIEPVIPPRPATMTVNVGDQVDAAARAGKTIAEIEQLLGGFTRKQKDT